MKTHKKLYVIKHDNTGNYLLNINSAKTVAKWTNHDNLALKFTYNRAKELNQSMHKNNFFWEKHIYIDEID